MSAIASGCKESSVPAPTIESISPQTVEQRTPATLQIVGAHFLGQVALSLDSRRAAQMNQQFEVWVGEQMLDLPSVVLLNETSLTVQLPGMSAGEYAIRIKTPGQQWAALAGKLTVEASGVDSAIELADAGVQLITATDADVLPTTATDSGVEPTPTTDAGNSILPPATPDSGQPATVLKTQGRNFLDPCSERILIRGVEQVLAGELPANTDIVELLGNIADSGANAVRLNLPTGQSLEQLETILAMLAQRNLITFVLPPNNDWLGESDVRAALGRHTSHLVIDALYPQYNDRDRFLTEALAAISQVRGFGYQVPLFIRSNTYGRDFPALEQHGPQIVASDPLQNVITGWTAWWGSTNWYQTLYGMTLDEAAQSAANASFPIILGITHQTDQAPEDDDFMNYGSLMTTAQSLNLGWTWGSWYNPNESSSLSQTGSETELLSLGEEVVTTHEASFANTSRRGCQGQ